MQLAAAHATPEQIDRYLDLYERHVTFEEARERRLTERHAKDYAGAAEALERNQQKRTEAQRREQEQAEIIARREAARAELPPVDSLT